MNSRHDRAPHRTPHHLLAVVVCGVLLIGALVVGISLQFSRAVNPLAASVHRLSSHTPGPSAAASASFPITQQTATTTVGMFLHQLAQVTPATQDVKAALASVATGAIIDAIQNQQQELKSNGWTQRGTAIVTSASITARDLTKAAPTATVSACIDSSDVITLDSTGKPITGAGSPTTNRAINIYGLQQVDGRWMVVSQTFPDNPTC
jgi:hypothetical protein